MRIDEPALRESDIDGLRRLPGLTGLEYLDLSARRELEQAIERWPLLVELADRTTQARDAERPKEVPA